MTTHPAVCAIVIQADGITTRIAGLSSIEANRRHAVEALGTDLLTVVSCHSGVRFVERADFVMYALDFSGQAGVNMTAWALYGYSPIRGDVVLVRDGGGRLPETLLAVAETGVPAVIRAYGPENCTDDYVQNVIDRMHRMAGAR